MPIIEGTVIRLTVDHLPSHGDPKPLWLWWSKADATDADVDRCWQASPRRFGIEHTFRLLKHTLGWTAPQVPSKPSRPGPGRPPGSRNRQPAARHDVGLILVTGQVHQRPAHHKKGTKPRRTG